MGSVVHKPLSANLTLGNEEGSVHLFRQRKSKCRFWDRQLNTARRLSIPVLRVSLLHQYISLLKFNTVHVFDNLKRTMQSYETNTRIH
jgi:hypothetical protein